MRLRDEISSDGQNMFTIGLLLVHFVQCSMLKTTESDQFSTNFEVDSLKIFKKFPPLTVSDVRRTPNPYSIISESENRNIDYFLKSIIGIILDPIVLDIDRYIEQLRTKR
jgi:hypothetical protein